MGTGEERLFVYVVYCILRYSDVIPVIPVIPAFPCTADKLKRRNLRLKYLPLSLTQARSHVRHYVISDGRIRYRHSVLMLNFIWSMDEKLSIVLNSKERTIRSRLCTSKYSQKGCPVISLAKNSLLLQPVSNGLR